MAFRQFGGLQFSAKQNYVSNQYNMVSQLGVPLQIGEPGAVVKIVSNISGDNGSLQITDNVTINQSLQVNNGIIAHTNYGISQFPTLSLSDSSSNNQMDFVLCTQQSNWNPLVSLGDEVIVAIGGAGKGRQNMTITTWSDTNAGIRITPTSAMIGAGGGTPIPQYYFKSDVSGNTIQGNLNVIGNVTAIAFVQTSDYRIKDDVRLLSSHPSIHHLRPVEYINLRTGIPEMGLIAHEVQTYFPHLVVGEKDDPNTYQAVNYIGFIPLLIKEIQDLKKALLAK
ncbi:MAG: tail fiber domain-containing protein [Flavobacterium sp.]